MEDRLIDMFSTSGIIREINNANYKGYVQEKLKHKIENENLCHPETIPDSFKFKGQENIKTKEPPETIAERVKLKRQNTGIGIEIKILTPNTLLTRLPILLAEIKPVQ